MEFDYILIKCDYPFNDEGDDMSQVMKVDSELDSDTIDEMVLKHLSDRTGYSADDLEDSWGWDYITIEELDEY